MKKILLTVIFSANIMNAYITVLPPQPSPESEIGKALGKGLGEGIQALIEQWHQQLQQEDLAEKLRLSELPEVLAYLEPEVQASYLVEYGASQQQAKQELLRLQELQELVLEQTKKVQLKELAYQEQLEELSFQKQLMQQELQELSCQKKLIEYREQKMLLMIILLFVVLALGFVFLKLKQRS